MLVSFVRFSEYHGKLTLQQHDIELFTCQHRTNFVDNLLSYIQKHTTTLFEPLAVLLFAMDIRKRVT